MSSDIPYVRDQLWALAAHLDSIHNKNLAAHVRKLIPFLRRQRFVETVAPPKDTGRLTEQQIWDIRADKYDNPDKSIKQLSIDHGVGIGRVSEALGSPTKAQRDAERARRNELAKAPWV